jgi:transcriptional regulator with XRE-family HTH domain
MSSLSSLNANLAIGQRLAAVRAKAGLIQQTFAERLGLSPRAYHNYERGEREIPVALLTALYEAYRIDPLWILMGPGSDPVQADARPDPVLLEDVVLAVDRWLKRRRKTLPLAKRAHLIRLLYEHFLSTGELDAQYLDTLATLAA